MSKCLNPVDSWICGTVVSQDGIISPKLVFSHSEALQYYCNIFGSPLGLKFLEKNYVPTPCGKCMQCLIKKRKDLTTRLSHESSLYNDNVCFITLTYNDDNIPTTDGNTLDSNDKIVLRGTNTLPNYTLLVKDVQKFMKRLRRHLDYIPKGATLDNSKVYNRKGVFLRDHLDKPIRYYIVGEYGSHTKRPHYHLLVFGWKPSDMDYFSSRNGHIIYRSKQIEKLWTLGFSTVEPVRGGVAKYCARYVTKKITNDYAAEMRRVVFPTFILQSTKHGGIGAPWFDKYGVNDMLCGYTTYRQGDYIVKASIPSYYLSRCRKTCPELWLTLRNEKIAFIKSHPHNSKSFSELINEVKTFEANEQRLVQNEFF